VGILVVAGSDAPELFELVEETLDCISLAIDPFAESKVLGPIGFWWNVRPSLSFGGESAQCVGIVGAVSEKDCALTKVVKQVGCDRAVMGLPGS